MSVFSTKKSIPLVFLIVFCLLFVMLFGAFIQSPFDISAQAASKLISSFEAEKAILSSKSIISKKASGYTGTGFVAFPAKKVGTFLTIKPILKIAESLQIDIRYSNPCKGSSLLVLSVNGKTSKLYFGKTFGASKWKLLTLTRALKKGTNTISLKQTIADLDSVNIDNIKISRKIIPSPTPKPTLSPLKLKFKGKKVLCMGDSITAFCGYPETLSDLLGTTVYNGGVSGTRTINGGNVDKLSLYEYSVAITSGNWTAQDAAVAALNDGNTSTNYATLKSVDFTKLDYLVISYGTNDFALSNQIGNDSDLAPTQKTFKGALNKAIELFKASFPNLKILLVSPIFRVSTNGNSDTYDWGTGHFLIEFVDATIQIGTKNGVPVLDNYRNSKINKNTASQYLNDGTHPNYLGAEYIASKVANKLFSSF
ncbi:MAG: GDSL-type esterase/lipase family protein [Bacillota bacterium]